MKIGRWKAARWASMLTGSTILAFGLSNVHYQSGITEGGVLGMTLLLQHWVGLSPALSEAVLDICCYLLGLKFLGKVFLKNALAATGGFTLSYTLFERIGFVLPSMADKPLLAAVVGGVFVGVGVGMVVRAGGAAGGDDALALVISKLFCCSVSQAYLFTDLLVLSLSLSYIPLANILCSMLTVTLSSWIIGRINAWRTPA